MTWLKYSDAPIDKSKLETRPQRRELRNKYEKPRGFWITDDGEDCWKTWCLGENFETHRLSHKHEVVLDEARVLIVRSAFELDTFTREFSDELVWFTGSGRSHTDLCVNWARVAERYAGLIVTPYQWTLRLEHRFSWYYGWDCSSGCIWDATAILDVRLVEVDHAIGKVLLPDLSPG